MISELYNIAVYIPEALVNSLPDYIHNVVYCPHAKQKARERNILLPQNIYGGKIVEVEVQNKKIIKAVYRIWYSKNKDLTLVFHVINGKPEIVRTLWINQHGVEKRINPSRYTHG